MSKRRLFILLALIGLAGLLIVGCRPGGPAVAPTPTKTRALPSLPTLTPVAQVTALPSPTPSPAPTLTLIPSPEAVEPSPTAPPPTAPPPLPDTPIEPSATATAPPSATPKPPTAAPSPVPATQTPAPAARPPLPAQEGGAWDMEAGFVPGVSPLGEDCPGWAVAVGWQAFLAPGTPASCLNENKNAANVRNGERSQEITFDFISAEAGIYKQAQTIPGQRYQIEAWGKHVRSASPVELTLGVDLTGGQDWRAASVAWHPWDETEEETWVHTQITVKASGERLTVFLKGYHPFAEQGGATMFDDVRVADLGP